MKLSRPALAQLTMFRVFLFALLFVLGLADNNWSDKYSGPLSEKDMTLGMHVFNLSLLENSYHACNKPF